MTPRSAGSLTLLGLLVVLLVAVAAAMLAPPSTLKDASTALAVIAATAVGIERTLEAFWTYVGLAHNAWWPLNVIARQVDELLNGVNESLEPFYDEVTRELERAHQAGDLTEEALEEAQAYLRTSQGRLQTLRGQLAPDAQNVQLVAATAFQTVSYLESKVPQVSAAAAAANQAIVNVSDFVATFKDNPARRLISIWAGALIGLVISGFLGLDVVAATLGDEALGGNVGQAGSTTLTARAPTPLFTIWFLVVHTPQWGVALTGLVMGLGANPTHELIRTLQEIKKSRKVDNAPAPAANVVPSAVMVLDPAAQGLLPAAPPNVAAVPRSTAAVPGSSRPLSTYTLRRRQ